jgi:hypothetical protein
VSAPGQLRDDQMGVYRELELEVGVACGLANKLRARHLEEYDLRRDPAAAAGPSWVIERFKAGRLKLDAELSAGREVGHNGRGALAPRADLGSGESSRRPSAPPPSPPEIPLHQSSKIKSHNDVPIFLLGDGRIRIRTNNNGSERINNYGFTVLNDPLVQPVQVACPLLVLLPGSLPR